MITTNLKRSAAALAVTAGLLAAAAPANAARPAGMTGDAGNDVLVWGLGNPTSVKAKAAKGKHGKGKVATAAATLVSVREKGSGLPTGVVAHGGQRPGAVQDADNARFRGFRFDWAPVPNRSWPLIVVRTHGWADTARSSRMPARARR